MAAALPPPEDGDKHLSELESVRNEEEIDRKLKSMSIFGFDVASWMKVWFNKDKVEEFKAEWLSIDEYKRQAEEGLQNSWRVLNLPNWRLEKRGSTKGDIVESVHTDDYGKVYRFTGIVDCPIKFLHDEFKNNIVRIPEWNPTILQSELIKEIADGIDLTYQVTAGGGRGIIAPRDFINLRRVAPITKDGHVTDGEPYCYIISAISVKVPDYPPRSDMVRGNNKIGCWVMKPKVVQLPGGKIVQNTVFQWLLCCDLKGKIPQFVLDTAFSTVMLDYIVHLRKFAANAKAKGLF